ncbi:MAG: class I SAM-dependent methyltransferase [Streptosporangiaceae bacterium]|nr:class I SAM-dependent methyltransferase [Streptosporangiaceae bacterium]
MTRIKTRMQPQALNQATEGIDRINVTGGATGAPAEGSRIKTAISSVYDSIAGSWNLGDTWNWGLYDPEIARELNDLIAGYDQFSTDGFAEQMYYYTLRQIPIPIHYHKGKRILEIGSGLGGGLNFLSRVLPGTELTGLDISRVAVQRASSRYSRPGTIHFTYGDAESLPFEDHTFDAVLNIESSHNYPNLETFLAEVARVLIPGGYFSITDFFTDVQQARLDQAKAKCTHLEWIAQTDVSEQVGAAVRQRMAPGSYVRTTLARQRMSLIRRIIARHAAEASMGGLFTGDASKGPFARWVRKVAGVGILDQATIRAYVNHVAVRRPNTDDHA